jgi:hypothetical protein
MSTTRTGWLALCAIGALIFTVGVFIAIGEIRLLPWLALPVVAALVWWMAPTIDRLRFEHRIKVEAAEGIDRLEKWLRTAPGLATASAGAVVECCPICGTPVDPRDATCWRHGAAT